MRKVKKISFLVVYEELQKIGVDEAVVQKLKIQKLL